MPVGLHRVPRSLTTRRPGDLDTHRPGPLPPRRQRRRGRRAHPGGDGARVRTVGPSAADGLPAGIPVPDRHEPAPEPPPWAGPEGAATPPTPTPPGPGRGGSEPGHPPQGARLAPDRSTRGRVSGRGPGDGPGRSRPPRTTAPR